MSDLATQIVTLSDLKRMVLTMPPERVGQFLADVLAASQAWREFHQSCKQAGVDFLVANNIKRVPVETARGTEYFTLFPKVTRKCENARETFFYILETEGKEGVANALGSQPFKPVTCKDILGDQWCNHFTEKYDNTIEPTKALKMTFGGMMGGDDE